jgi:hypothetical protein
LFSSTGTTLLESEWLPFLAVRVDQVKEGLELFSRALRDLLSVASLLYHLLQARPESFVLDCSEHIPNIPNNFIDNSLHPLRSLFFVHFRVHREQESAAK